MEDIRKGDYLSGGRMGKLNVNEIECAFVCTHACVCVCVRMFNESTFVVSPAPLVHQSLQFETLRA